MILKKDTIFYGQITSLDKGLQVIQKNMNLNSKVKFTDALPTIIGSQELRKVGWLH